jgi:MoxR-like ATPase
MRAGQALAALRGRDFTLPDDIKSLAIPALAHRLILKEQNRLRGENAKKILEGIIDRIPVPAASG